MNESWKRHQNLIHEEARASHLVLNIRFSNMICRLLLCKDTQPYLIVLLSEDDFFVSFCFVLKQQN